MERNKGFYKVSLFQVLSTIEGTGPTVLLHPQDWYSLCISIGLLPRPMDIASTNPNLVSDRFKGYSKTCVKRPLNNRQNKDLYDNW